MIAPSLLDEVRPLATRFADAGHQLYLVGGIVRDQQLGRPLAPGGDIDLTTDAAPKVIKALVAGLADAVWTQGERFGTIGCRIADREYEITTHRGESYDPESRKPTVVFSDAIEHDLERRDFTVNAMAVRLPAGELVDPFGGRHDLEAHVLRTPLSPEVSFSDDPLRMLRAARFVAGYALVPDAALLAAVEALAPRLTIVSAERRRDELDKLLLVADPRPGLQLVLERGLAPYVVPALVDVGDAVAQRAVAAVGALPAGGATRLAAIVAPEDHVDRATVARRLRDLRYSNDTVTAVSTIVAGAAHVWAAPATWSARDVRAFAATTGAWREEALLLASTRVDISAVRVAIDEIAASEDLDSIAPALDGDQVMSLLGIGPGAAVGEALAFLRAVRIEEGEIDPADARRRVLAWWAARA